MMQLDRVQADVRHLIGEMRALLIENRRFNELSDQLETLVMAHVEPSEPDPWMRNYGLTPKEALFASYLHSKLGKDCHRDSIMSALYFNRPDDEPELKIIDVWVCKIRAKLKAHNSPYSIISQYGKGYRMVERKPLAKAA